MDGPLVAIGQAVFVQSGRVLLWHLALVDSEQDYPLLESTQPHGNIKIRCHGQAEAKHGQHPQVVFTPTNCGHAKMLGA